MRVIKRDGRVESLDISKIRKQTIPACEGLNYVSSEELEIELNKVMSDKIKTSEIQEELIKIAMTKTSIDRPDWAFVAARLALYDLYHKVKHFFGVSRSGNVYELVSLKDYLDKAYELERTKYNSKDYERMGFDLDELQEYVKSNCKRDYQFTIMGLNIYLGRYALKNKENEPFELPQHAFMHIAMMLAAQEKENKTEWAKKFYDVISRFEVMMATPTLSNLRKKFSNCFSCYVGCTGDSLESIMEGYKEKALISKWGGGLGWDYSLVRSLGGPIQNIKGLAKGKIPFLKVDNDLMLAVDQLGQRPGAENVYINVWDKDIFDFLDLKKSGGDERRVAEDLFISVIIDDVFMEQAEKDGEYWLFDPYDVPELNHTYGDEFKKKYWEYVEKAKENPKDFWNEPVKINARDIMRRIVKYMGDVGMPFIFFKDNVNRAHKHPDEGMIRTSNLCMEVAQPTTPQQTAICNLASVNLSKVNTPEKIKEVVPVVVRMLDNVNDATDYIMPKHEKHQKRTRAIGLGVMGEAELVATKQIMYGSKEHKELVDKLYQEIYGTAEEASKELANEKGEWKEGKGTRNAYIGAIAPTSSIALLTGTTPSHEPVFKRFWLEDGIFGKIPVVAPKLSADTYMYYISAYDVNQRDMLELTSIRQKYVDQAISHNLYYDPNKITGKVIFEDLIWAWRNGVKTIYYTRTASKKIEKESDKIACHGCE